MSETVIITGGTGYLGQHIIAELLKHEYKVVATARTQIAATNLIKLFAHPYLQTEVVEKYEEPGALDYVLKQHKEAKYFIASAAVTDFQTCEPEELENKVLKKSDFIIENTLHSISKHGHQIERVIYTSSSSTMISPQDLFAVTKHYIDDPEAWSNVPYEAGKHDRFMSYIVSKIEGEKKLLAHIKDNQPKFDLVSILPAFLTGPVVFRSEINLDHLPSTTKTVGDLLKLNKDSYVPELATGGVDVRDAAKAHVAVLNNPKASNQRILVEAYKLTTPNILNIIRKDFPQYTDKLPVLEPIPESEFVLPDDKRSKEILGFDKYYTLKESIDDLVKQIVE
ncbi:uncharacterized protein KGF55_004401 [Candida pseudojiufengensis]|uniref:uncharacterized protein n=1 Tax=Candida pseudojiufengensis TaxID=497109 RepID=UPI002224A3D7|nr:uncharacterized protein KGF55_004401 [Candida pseudojiufengensis]KAI5960831.1 hypothetical protein KGF55_004401 [Candida pseudojiufengensis]